MGFRGVPHFVIAVNRQEGEGFWILRATVNTDYFSKLVDAARLGRTGETFIVNRQGLYQTRTHFAGKLLEPSGYPDLVPHDGIRVRRLELGGEGYFYTTTWLAAPATLISLEASDACPLRRAIVVGILMSAAGSPAPILPSGGALQVRCIKRRTRRRR
jgi:two-component system NtrC family sensor kinase